MDTLWSVPMLLLIEEIVLSALVTAWRFAGSPTNLSPVFVNATTDGVVLAPSVLATTTGFPPSITATHEFVVPKSIPIILLIINLFSALLIVYITGLLPGSAQTQTHLITN